MLGIKDKDIALDQEWNCFRQLIFTFQIIYWFPMLCMSISQTSKAVFSKLHILYLICFLSHSYGFLSSQ